jgi:hypothetical protein
LAQYQQIPVGTYIASREYAVTVARGMEEVAVAHDPEALWFTANMTAWKSVRPRGLYWCIDVNS